MFMTRLASGVVLVVIALGTMGYGGIPLALVLWAISMVAFRELTKATGCATGERKWNGLEWLGIVATAVYYIILYVDGSDIFSLMCIVGFFLLEMFVYVAVFPRYQAHQVMAAVFAFLYGPVMLSFVYQTRMGNQGFYVVWMILISSWGCDTCAYVVGKLIGRKKIFPLLSPKKSLEGCVGGVLGAALIGWLYGHFFVEAVFPEQTVGWIISLICGVGAVMSMVGDLAASGIKRNAQIKDYGKLIPGHGGIMDRFDSMIVTAPMTYFLTLLLLAA